MNSTNLQVLTQINRALIIESDMAALLIKPGINTIKHVVIERQPHYIQGQLSHLI